MTTNRSPASVRSDSETRYHDWEASQVDLPSTPIRLLLAESQESTRDQIRSIFTETDVDIVADAIDCEEAVCLALALDVDIVMMNTELPDGDTIKVLGRIKNAKRRLPVLAYSPYLRLDQVNRYRMAGASGYLFLASDAGKLETVVRDVTFGRNISIHSRVVEYSPT